jgi:hypothetical protein
VSLLFRKRNGSKKLLKPKFVKKLRMIAVAIM